MAGRVEDSSEIGRGLSEVALAIAERVVAWAELIITPKPSGQEQKTAGDDMK